MIERIVKRVFLQLFQQYPFGLLPGVTGKALVYGGSKRQNATPERSFP